MTDAAREFWITLYDGMAWSSLAYAKKHEENLRDLALGVAHVREVPPPQPRTLYLCEDPGLIPTIHKTAIDATKAALSYGPGATVSEWREVLS